MAWQINLSGLAQKNLQAIDRVTAARILRFLHERIAPSSDPRRLGEALKGEKLGVFWKYRVGSYRIIADIQESTVYILVVRIGNRREIYK